MSVHLQVIDDYVSESPILSSVESDWLSTATVACGTALNLLGASYSMAKNSRQLKTKVATFSSVEIDNFFPPLQCAYLLGHCFDLIAEFSNPDPPQQWTVVAPAIKETDSTLSAMLEPKELGDKYSALSMIFRQQEANASEIDEKLSLKFVSQTIHTFTEAISLAVSSRQWV